MQNLFLVITPFMFYSLAWLCVVLAGVLFMLYRENKRLKHLSEISHWGCSQLIDAARRAYSMTTFTAARRWELFLEDIQKITETIRNEKQNKKPTS